MKIANLSDSVFSVYDTDGRTLAYFDNHDDAQKFVDRNEKKDVKDDINHPYHYNNHPSGVECITIVEHMTYNLGCAVSYIWRAGLKEENPKEKDLRKAVWHINREIERVAKFRRMTDVT